MFRAGSVERWLRVVLMGSLLAFASAPLRAELLLFYSFNDDSDPLVAVDESGQGNDGVVSGNDFDLDGIPETPAVYTDPGLGRTGGPNDRALDFLTTAEGTYVSVPSAAAGAFDSLTANDTATVTMWLLGSDAQPVNQWNFWFGPNRQLGSHVPWSDGVIYFDVAGCCGANQRLQQAEGDPARWKGEWNHYAFVKDIDATRIYQNGVLWAEGFGKSPLGAITEVFFGAGDSTHVSNYNGLMDDVGVWDEALPEDEIVIVMESGVGPPLPVTIRRDIPDTLINGTSGLVTITVSPRVPGALVVINEKIPPGLTASNPSHAGVLAGDTITWNLGAVDAQVVLSYTLAASLDAASAKFESTATVNGQAANIGGDTTYTGTFFTSLGFIKLWNHLGPLAYAFPSVVNDHGPPGGCDANGTDLVLDWIVNEDGTVTELDVQPFPGRLLRPAYGGDGLPGGTGARAAGLTVAAGDNGAVTRDSFPVWKGTLTRGDTIDHAGATVNGFDAEDHMTMSSVYVTNTTGAPIDTQLGFGSDDSIQIYLDDVDLTAGGIYICRGWGAANEEQNTVPVSLPAGESRLLIKVTDGCCASGFRLRFQDPVDPFLPGLMSPDIRLSLESAANPPPASAVRSLSPATYNQGEPVSVSIAVNALAPSNVTLTEVLPFGASAAEISDGGVLAGGEVKWTLNGITARTVTYKLAPPSCAPNATFGQSTWAIGNVEALVGGPATVSRNPIPDQGFGPDWRSLDIGYTGGAALPLGPHEALVDAGGNGVELRADQFRFIHMQEQGDFEISAQIDCMDDSGLVAQAGLMVRDTLDPFSANVFLFLTTGDLLGSGVRTLRGSFRRTTEETRITSLLNIPGANADVDALPIYLKLARVGNLISFYRSADGVNYGDAIATREVGTGTTQVALNDQVLIGLAVSGRRNRAGVTFRQVSGPEFRTGGVAEDCSVAGDEDGDGKADCADEDCAALPQCQVTQLHRGDADQNGQLQLTDAIQILGFLFLGAVTKVPDCQDAADADDNGQLQLTDAIRILGFLFLGGPAPAPPGPPGNPCGPDPGGELGCNQYTGC